MFKQKSDSASPALAPADAVQRARTRARQRLIGAVILLGIGIVGFPLVFETQPRPIPVDIPIEIPKKDALPPLSPVPAASQIDVAPMPAPLPTPPSASRAEIAAMPASTARREDVITESRNEAGRDVTPQSTRPAASAAPVADGAASKASLPVARVAAASASAGPAASKPAGATPSESERARALLEGRPVASAEAQRFVVQVGAFAEVNAAREVRLKVEKLGLRTYTQIAQTPEGSRIRVRVGPFASRAEADAALAKAKGAGLAAVVLTL
jgi:DedD protein